MNSKKSKALKKMMMDFNNQSGVNEFFVPYMRIAAESGEIAFKLLKSGQSIQDYLTENNTPDLVADHIKRSIDFYIDAHKMSYIKEALISEDVLKKIAGMSDADARTCLKSLFTWERDGEPLMTTATYDDIKAAAAELQAA